MFKGSIVAIVTPFKEGRGDEEAYRELIEFQIENGTSAIVPCGTTGESATLDHDEHCEAIALVVEHADRIGDDRQADGDQQEERDLSGSGPQVTHAGDPLRRQSFAWLTWVGVVSKQRRF